MTLQIDFYVHRELIISYVRKIFGKKLPKYYFDMKNPADNF